MFVPYYYGCDGFRDEGWGCVYRCIQAMLHTLGEEVLSLPSMMRTLGIDHAPQNPTSMWIEPVDAKTFLVNAPTELALYMSDASQVHRMRRTTPEDAQVRLNTGDELLEYLREGLKAGPVLVDDGTRSYLLTEDLGEIGFALMDPHRKKHQMRVAPPEWFTGELSLLWMILRLVSPADA